MKKALAWLEGRKIAYEFHDYKKSGVPAERVRTWIDQVGWETVLNTKGTTFRNLPPARQRGLDAAKAATLMIEFPSAIKRPVIESGRKSLLVGFDAASYEKSLA